MFPEPIFPGAYVPRYLCSPVFCNLIVVISINRLQNSPHPLVRWPSGLERWTGDRTVRGSNPTAENFSLRNFGNSVYPALPVSFGGDTKSRRSLLSGVYARGNKRPHQSSLECVTVVDSTAHSKLTQKCVYAAENAALH